MDRLLILISVTESYLESVQAPRSLITFGWSRSLRRLYSVTMSARSLDPDPEIEEIMKTKNQEQWFCTKLIMIVPGLTILTATCVSPLRPAMLEAVAASTRPNCPSPRVSPNTRSWRGYSYFLSILIYQNIKKITISLRSHQEIVLIQQWGVLSWVGDKSRVLRSTEKYELIVSCQHLRANPYL